MAELIAGEIGRYLGLNVPSLALVELGADIPKSEPDQEIREHLQRSVGTNLGLDFLPGALPFLPATNNVPDPVLAADIVWFDAFVANVDRTIRNTNMLIWGNNFWLIDHGAAILPHHKWTDPATQARSPFASVKDHVLLPFAGSIVEADVRLSTRLDDSKLWSVISSVPDSWLGIDPDIGDAEAQRDAYMTYFQTRLQGPRPFVGTAEAARTASDLGAIDPHRATRGRRRE